MKIIILGSGVIGVTTAYYAARAGHEVTVLERQPGPALETSFANAGEVSPGYSAPWAAPGIPLKALKWLFMKHRPLVIWPLPDPMQWRWGLMMLRNCTSARYKRNKGRMLPIAGDSRDPDGTLKSKGLVNTREHLESMVESMETGIESLQDYVRLVESESDRRLREQAS
jgi:D-amino-acid dehydrogenase